MQLASQFEHPWRVALLSARLQRNTQVMVIGFDDAVTQIISEYLTAMSLEIHICAEPFDGLSALIEDPGAWMCCIVDAAGFVTDTAFQRYLQLFAFEGEDVGIILGNADVETVELLSEDDGKGIDRAVLDISELWQFREAITSVMTRRGYVETVKEKPCPLLIDRQRRHRARHQVRLNSLPKRLGSAKRVRNQLRDRRLLALPLPA